MHFHERVSDLDKDASSSSRVFLALVDAVRSFFLTTEIILLCTFVAFSGLSDLVVLLSWAVLVFFLKMHRIVVVGTAKVVATCLIALF